MSLIYRILYLVAALAGGYSLMVVVLNMFPTWPLPSQVSQALSWVLSSLSVANWLLPVDTLLQIFVLSFLRDNWLWFWRIARGIYRVVIGIVSGSAVAVQGDI